MKKLFLLLASIVAICSCNKENSKIDLSLVNVEIELSCIDEEPNSSSSTTHTILCTGKIGGFTGDAKIEISSGSPYYLSAYNRVSVAGESTSFSFTFTEAVSDEYNNKPITCDVEVIGPNNETIFKSSVVIYL